MNKIGIAGIYLFTALAIGCSNPSIVNVSEQETSILTSSAKIFIPRFEGRPDFVEESTDLFVAKLEANIPNTIIQGSVLRTETTDIKSGSNLAPIDVALDTASKNSADILIMGKVTSHRTAGSLNGFSTIRIYNVSTRKRVANFHRPSGLLVGYSEHQCVMAAVQRTAKDVSEIFK